ncbi:MAG: SIS domain-containing protein [Phycisphaerae bacterium]|nr:SIS domain-containing protein [Phycisphaerae bacterium]
MSIEWESTLQDHLTAAAAMRDQATVLDGIADAIIAAIRNGKRVYVLGNGGSAADAQHIAAELLGRFRTDRAALPAIALTTDSSVLTAISNDLGYERVFARQVEGLVQAGDVVWALSTSGNSPNVLEAVRAAAARGAVTIAFTGASGHRLAECCAHRLLVPHKCSDRIQECHQIAYHYVCGRVEAAFAGK